MSRNEYLSQDVMAFAGVAHGSGASQSPYASSRTRPTTPRRVLALEGPLRAVRHCGSCFATGPSQRLAPLVAALADMVVDAMPITSALPSRGETLVVVGSRDEAVTFPYGFFRAWKLNPTRGALSASLDSRQALRTTWQ